MKISFSNDTVPYNETEDENTLTCLCIISHNIFKKSKNIVTLDNSFSTSFENWDD